MTKPWLPRLIVITHAERFGWNATLRAASTLCTRAKPRSVVIQLREEERSTRELFEFGKALLEICNANAQALCINDRLDIALAVGTPRLHLKATSTPAAQSRGALEERFGTSWLTQGWHPVDAAPPSGLDAVLVSPALADRKGRPALGLVALARAVAQTSPTPAFALGGIDGGAIAALSSLPLAGIAVQAAWYHEPDEVLSALHIARV